MTLRVAVDATAIPERRVGAGVYITELLRHLASLDLDLHVFVNRRDAGELSSLVAGATLHPVGFPNRVARLAWARSVLPSRVRRIGPDVFHGPHYTLPPRLSRPGVVTFHDPTFFTHAELHERSKVAYFTRAARMGVERAARVVAISEYSRRGAIDEAGADPDRVDVVLHGVDQSRYNPGDGPEPELPFEPFILFVGALEPRKNVPALVAAYAKLAGDGLPHQLVLAGPPAWGAGAVDAAVSQLGPGVVHRVAYVPESEKIALYRRASLFVYPSIAEGFGLPVLEAMACGTPVITTTGSAPEEVCGDAAILVPPRDDAVLVDAMRRVLSDDGLAAELRRRGPERARGFTWARTAEQTADVYRRAVGKAGG